MGDNKFNDNEGGIIPGDPAVAGQTGKESFKPGNFNDPIDLMTGKKEVADRNPQPGEQFNDRPASIA